MNIAGMGDLAQSHLLRNRNAALKQTIARLTDELATGQVKDVRETLAGNYSFLTDVERKTTVLDGYKIATTEATQFTDSMQLALEQIQDSAANLSSMLLSVGSSGSTTAVVGVPEQARAVLESLINTLNTEAAGRHLFSGNETDQNPLLDAGTLMTDLLTAVSGATTPADLVAQATTWFDDPAGFAASMYQGGIAPLSGFALSPDDTVNIDVRADNPGLTGMLLHAAVAALSADPTFGFDATQQAEVLTLSGEGLLTGQYRITSLQAHVGHAQASIETITVRNAAELSSLTMAKNALLEADPFDAATKLEEAQFQLQSLYSVTVRMSQLSLVNYL